MIAVPVLAATAKERTGYPTQKPVKLLERIVLASSNPGDIVLDPFAGCATACVAAEHHERQWIGIDLSPLAAELVERRLRDRARTFARCIRRDDIPQRTDIGDLPAYRTHKHHLYGQQEGVCAGCRVFFPFRNLTVDHVHPAEPGRHTSPDEPATPLRRLQQPQGRPLAGLPVVGAAGARRPAGVVAPTVN